jgi:hypothetical protein
MAAMRRAGELAEQGKPGKTSEAPTLSDYGVKRWRANEWAKLLAPHDADAAAPRHR